jgi:cobalt-zinc-cadmium efflux system protein
MEHNQAIYNTKRSASQGSARSLFFSLLLTALVFLVELIGGYVSRSLALIADAGHMATDMLSLAVSYLAVWIANKPATKERTYGFYRVEILAALFNGILLFLIAVFIAVEAVERLFEPARDVESVMMFAFGVVGFIANVISAYWLHHSKDASVNVRAAYLHVLSDLLGSVGVILGAALIALTHLAWIDSVISLLIAVLIVRSGWGIVTESVDVLLESTPHGVDCAEVETALRAETHVVDIHDLHIWSITTGVHALSCHIVVDEYDCSQRLILSLHAMLKEKFSIDHVTIQLENATVSQTIAHRSLAESAEKRFAKSSHHHGHTHHGHSHQH